MSQLLWSQLQLLSSAHLVVHAVLSSSRPYLPETTSHSRFRYRSLNTELKAQLEPHFTPR